MKKANLLTTLGFGLALGFSSCTNYDDYTIKEMPLNDSTTVKISFNELRHSDYTLIIKSPDLKSKYMIYIDSDKGYDSFNKIKQRKTGPRGVEVFNSKIYRSELSDERIASVDSLLAPIVEKVKQHNIDDFTSKYERAIAPIKGE